ncbi:hypothetical protein HOL24_06210 [bacterium]|jgi:hypothetical protein|nr:hypothetical protein [bacterium]
MLQGRQYPICNADNNPRKSGLKMGNVQIENPDMDSGYFIKKKDIEVIIIGSWSSQEDIYQSLKFLEDGGITIIKLIDRVDCVN